ncbi:MAG: hypothetical protein ACXVA2_22165, partial [Mucilaginibacter sp.]
MSGDIKMDNVYDQFDRAESANVYDQFDDTSSKKSDEAGAFRSYVGIPLEKGIADIGGAVGYGLGEAGFDRAGRALQDSSQRVQDTLTSRQSQQAQDDASKALIDDNGNYGGYNLGTLSQDVFGSLPGTVAMGVAGAPLAAGVTGLSR